MFFMKEGMYDMAVFQQVSDSEIIQELKAAVRDGAVITDPARLDNASLSNYASLVGSRRALVLVEAGSEDDVAAVLAVARKYHLPVVPQSTNSNTVASADGITHGIILSTNRMNKILEINTTDSVAVVQPGVINNDLDEACRKQGFFFPPDPGSRLFSRVGGNTATNAGGMGTLRYGATRDNVLGLRVVLADGRRLSLGGRTLKQAYGYDLAHLFVGSEGTLGVITQITFKILPLPLGPSMTGAAFFDDMEKACAAAAAVRNSGVYPSMLEAIDGPTLQAINELDGTHYGEGAGAMLLFRLDTATDQAKTVLDRLLKEHGGRDVQLATTKKEQDALIALRRNMLPAVFSRGHAIMEDMCLPLSKMAEMMKFISDLGKKYGLEIYRAGHAGDGNVHPTVVWHGSTDVPQNVIDAIREMFWKTLALGGTISGEHAVGMLKNDWNNAELGGDVDYLQHQIKGLLDPMHIMNPGRKID